MYKKKVFLLSSFLILFISFFIFSKIASALGNPVKISNSSNDAIFPQTNTDSKGYLHMVWQELTPGQSWRVLAREYFTLAGMATLGQHL